MNPPLFSAVPSHAGICFLFFLRLKAADVVIRNTKEAEDTLKSYETRLRDVSKVPTEEKEVEDHRNLLKVRRSLVGRVDLLPDSFI